MDIRFHVSSIPLDSAEKFKISSSGVWNTESCCQTLKFCKSIPAKPHFAMTEYYSPLKWLSLASKWLICSLVPRRFLFCTLLKFVGYVQGTHEGKIGGKWGKAYIMAWSRFTHHPRNNSWAWGWCWQLAYMLEWQNILCRADIISAHGVNYLISKLFVG